MSDKTAVILMNTGSPAAPTEAALRTYLKEFLSDPRIIELPSWLWQPILRGIILRTRPAKSARRYRKIWMPDGSPLIVYTQKVLEALNERLSDDIVVAMAMKVGSPSVEQTVARLKKDGINRFIFFPMFAQYATQTTESALDGVRELKEELKDIHWDWIRPFYNRADFIEALAAKIQSNRTPGAHLVMSFHGIPVKSIQKGSPYEKQCRETAQSIAAKLQLKGGDYSIAYQSRFGNDHWLQPYLTGHVESLVHQGVRSIDVVCLSFSVDCLETLEEIGIELKNHFLSLGGEHFNLLPCLNDDANALDCYEKLILESISTLKSDKR